MAGLVTMEVAIGNRPRPFIPQWLSDCCNRGNNFENVFKNHNPAATQPLVVTR